MDFHFLIQIVGEKKRINTTVNHKHVHLNIYVPVILQFDIKNFNCIKEILLSAPTISTSSIFKQFMIISLYKYCLLFIVNALIFSIRKSVSPSCPVFELWYAVSHLLMSFLNIYSLFSFSLKNQTAHIYNTGNCNICYLLQSSVIVLSTRFRFLFIVCNNSFLVSYTSAYLMDMEKKTFFWFGL